MSVAFKKLDQRKFGDFMEMGVKFGTGPQGDPLEDISDLYQAIDNFGIRSSIFCDYDDQEAEWRKLATAHKYDGLKELANAIAKITGGDGFEGKEGLAALTGNKQLMETCDYANAGDGDGMVMSFFYGGKRAKQWLKNARQFMTPETFIKELKNMSDYGILDSYGGVEKVEELGKGKVKIHFIQGDVNGKQSFHKMLEQADGAYDFEIVEEMQSDVWTITIRAA